MCLFVFAETAGKMNFPKNPKSNHQVKKDHKKHPENPTSNHQLKKPSKIMENYQNKLNIKSPKIIEKECCIQEITKKPNIKYQIIDSKYQNIKITETNPTSNRQEDRSRLKPNVLACQVLVLSIPLERLASRLALISRNPCYKIHAWPEPLAACLSSTNCHGSNQKN